VFVLARVGWPRPPKQGMGDIYLQKMNQRQIQNITIFESATELMMVTGSNW